MVKIPFVMLVTTENPVAMLMLYVAAQQAYIVVVTIKVSNKKIENQPFSFFLVDPVVKTKN